MLLEYWRIKYESTGPAETLQSGQATHLKKRIAETLDTIKGAVEEIKALGGEAVANKASVSDREGAKSIVETAFLNGKVVII